jgi:putative acetyltransferase
MAGSTQDVKIIEFESRYCEDFKNLNLEWIEKYFEVEPADEYVLNNPEEAVIQKGGKIFFAQEENQRVGTFCLFRVDEETFELGKMAVKTSHQQNGVGTMLLTEAIARSRQMGAKRITLYSNTQLCTALNLYIGHGFRVIPKTDFHSKRANIKMSLQLLD